MASARVLGAGALLAAGALGVGLAYLWRRVLRPPEEGAAAFEFDPDLVAYFEAAGWRAYYDRNWPRLLWLMVRLCQEQFRIPFPVSLLAASYAARAARAWVPLDHDERVVRHYYERFYRLARRYSGLRFDPARAAALELAYNDIHRRLVGNPDKAEFIETMVALHSAVFGIAPEQARESAELRVAAANAVDRITSRTSTDVEGDWAQVEDDLRRCYRALQRELRARDGHPARAPSE